MRFRSERSLRQMGIRQRHLLQQSVLSYWDGQGAAYGLPRQFPTIPTAQEMEFRLLRMGAERSRELALRSMSHRTVLSFRPPQINGVQIGGALDFLVTGWQPVHSENVG